MTLEQRVRRAERMLVIMANSGRRTRSEWGYRINGLIDAQMRFKATVHEAQKRNEAEARDHKERINKLIQSQMETEERIKSLAETQQKVSAAQEGLTAAQAELTVAQIELTHSQKLTDRTLRAFIESLRKGHNGSSSH